MQNDDTEALLAAVKALEAQRSTLGDRVTELALAPLRALLAERARPATLLHRQVTVLFADVAGSTALASGLEAEDTLALLNEALSRMAAIVEAHHGRVLRFTGDGVKAAFGMQAAREDDPERAVRAGLAILDAGREIAEQARRLHGVEGFALRVGVHTGDVALGAGVEADNTAMGAAVHIAARMEQSAPPGGLRISHDTWAHVRGLFDAEPQAPLEVRGLDAPMQTYLVRAARDRHRAQPERGLQGRHTPLVGRDDELQRLRETVDRAGLTRPLQALTLLGDAGLGKSRLLRELLAGLPDVRVLAVRLQPDGLLRPFGLLRSLLATQCGLADTDSAAEARRKVEQGLAPWFDDAGLRPARLMGQLAGLDFGDDASLRGLGARGLRDLAFAAVVSWLQALARHDGRPPLLVVEDLHWADEGSLDLLQHLQAQAASLPLALVMTSRPGLLERRPDWGPPETLLPLRPLAPMQGQALAQALLQPLGEVPPQLLDRVTAPAEGNPYYIEELVRRLIDDGVIVADGARWTLHADRLDRLRLPGTLVGLLQARLDALEAGSRHAARQASIIGAVFWEDALKALDPQAPPALPALQRAAIVRPRATSDFADTAEMQFDHHLLHQVTYDSLLKLERRQGHAAAARWLAERTQGRGAEFLAMTGEHAERAGDTALAVDCFERAAAEAERRFANAEALKLNRRALDLLGDAQPDRRFDLLFRMNSSAERLGRFDVLEALLSEIAALLDQHPDEARRARLLVSRSLLAERRGDGAASLQHADEAFELAERCGATRTAAKAKVMVAWRYWVRGDYATSHEHLRVGLSWAERLPASAERDEVEGSLLTHAAQTLGSLHRHAEALVAAQASLACSERLADPFARLMALQTLTTLAADLGRWSESAEWARRMHALAQHVGYGLRAAAAEWHLGYAAECMGDTDEALARYDRVLPACRTHGDRRKEALTLQRMAAVNLARGDAAAAWDRIEPALALYAIVDDPLEAVLTAALAARIQAGLGRQDAARQAVDDLLHRSTADPELSDLEPEDLLEMRWHCQRVLQTLDDPRAGPLLDRLVADVRAWVAQLVPAGEREALVQALPVCRAVMAAAAAPPLQ
jgi:class 3 adenylate cyclase/tetratricopeptide (TPR) repeat protein